MKIFTESQYNYSPVIKMLHSKHISFIKLTITIKECQKLCVLSIHYLLRAFLIKFFFQFQKKNIQSLAKEIYKFLNGLLPSFLNKIFHESSSNPFEIDKSFNPEILTELDMELKTYHIWHLKFGARSKKRKWAHL